MPSPEEGPRQCRGEGMDKQLPSLLPPTVARQSGIPSGDSVTSGPIGHPRIRHTALASGWPDSNPGLSDAKCTFSATSCSVGHFVAEGPRQARRSRTPGYSHSAGATLYVKVRERKVLEMPSLQGLYLLTTVVPPPRQASRGSWSGAGGAGTRGRPTSQKLQSPPGLQHRTHES